MSATTTWYRMLSDEGEPDVSVSKATSSLIDLLRSPLLFGAFILTCCMVFLSFAVQYEWIDELVPRIANRPKAVLKNALQANISEKYRNKIFIYPIAWIVWAYNLTYKQCIFGIPGTGTRKDGWEGPLLKTNLDAVVLLKFNTLLFKISLQVAFLCVFILIPIYHSAPCDPATFGEGSCAIQNNYTGFQKTTIANIPDKYKNNNTNATISGIEISATEIIAVLNPFNNKSSSNDGSNITAENGTITTSVDLMGSFATTLWVPDQTWRICATIICCLLIYGWTLYLLTLEWIEVVALRRAFFLEASHYGQRMQELNKLELDFDNRHKKGHGHDGKEVPMRDEHETYPPYMTHPEIRETPPSVGLYSVLFQLPNSMVTYDTNGATPVERQLVATTKYFDEIVPPQPGFSSSVAAVTVIPKARLVAKAWDKWCACESKLQILRHIRKLIAKAEKKKTGGVEKKKLKKSGLLSSFRVDKENSEENGNQTTTEAQKGDVDTPEQDEEKGHSIGLVRVEAVPRISEPNAVANVDSQDANEEIETHIDPEKDEDANTGEMDSPQEETFSSRTMAFKYEDFDVKIYAKSLGFCDEVDNMAEFVDGMGVEEFNVFAYRCALMEGGPGFGKKVLNIYNVEKLLEEERDIVEELREAQKELSEARANVIALDDDISIGSDDDEIHSNPSFGEIRQKKMLDLNVEDTEWIVPEDELNETIPILESQSNDKSEGKLRGLANLFRRIPLLGRIFFGPEVVDPEPKYYGTEPDNEGKAYMTDINHPSYAVVTFTSRHSAIIARQCLADGAVSNSWKQVDDIPIYPLADSPPMMCYPRGLMRPVTPTISYTSRKIRRWVILTVFCVFTVANVGAINSINNYIWSPKLWERAFGVPQSTLDGILTSVSGLTQTLLFSICPTIFKFLANSEGSASSMGKAELRAMVLFWYFYIFARFLGQVVWDMVVKFFFGDSSSVEDAVVEALSELALSIPTVLGPSAVSYIIFSCTVTFPPLYFLQLNNFWSSLIRLKWVNRLFKGGGPGAEIPFRIYIDNGYILSCMTALAPLCPLIGPFALLYFIILAPMLRWLVVFGYRPRFDGGGEKWPKLHHIIITSLLLGQVITMAALLLKGNLIEGIIIGFCVIPTLLYNNIIMEKFMRPFKDASLRHTGRISSAHFAKAEGRDSWPEREEFRRWLVDCHKASYLPTCLSGGRKNLLTAEPAIVVPKESSTEVTESSMIHKRLSADKSLRNLLQRQEAQKGGILRRQRFGI